MAQETKPAPFLGNPMEKTFNSGTIREFDGQAADIVRRTPPLPNTTANITNNEIPAVDIWNTSEPLPQITSDGTGNGFTGWNVGPPAVPSTSVQAQPPFAADASGSMYSNMNNTSFASPFNGINPNLQQNFPNLQPDYAALAAQYAQQYVQLQSSGAYNPYVNPYNNAVNFPQRQVQRGDLFSNMLMSGAFEQNPALYMAMYQQEALRHQQSLEEEYEKEREAEERAGGGASGRYPYFDAVVSCFKTISPFNTPTGPDRGVGMPLMNRSWLDRPFYIGGFVGTMSGSELVSNMIDQKSGADGGLIFGMNINDYWGLDSRLHFASLDIKETGSGALIYQQWYAARNPGAAFVPPLTTRTNQLTIVDVSV
ncbi:MAG: hypothetical protein FWE67_03490, partial [Planctomycetaceae bacterium]|nr:hypothetical protein [Planctomycetaceae bacterium]